MFFFAIFLITGMSAIAQSTVTGTVTGADDGETLPGVNVSVKGTTVGTMTNMDGKYSIEVPDGSTTLIFSFVGMNTQEVAISGSTADCSMTVENTDIEEIVVTALGISRKKKSLGYSVQDVKGDEMEKAGSETNAINALSGKVAGMSISSSSGNMGGSSRVLLRGASSFTGNNSPLYVVDGIPLDDSNNADANSQRGAGGYDMGSMAQDINPNDIASISVLKGPSASALYGSRAANGVIVITTKSGSSKKKGFGVSFSTGVTLEQVSFLPDYQNEYGGGYYDSFDVETIDGVDYNVPYYAADESWGPKLDGTQVAAWHNVYDYEQGVTSKLETSPWSPQPDNIKDFFETGVTYKNNVAFTGGDNKQNFRLSYTNMSRTGVFPASELNRNTVSFSGMKKIGSKLTVSSKVNYVSNYSKSLPMNGYAGGSIMQKFSQWGQRQWDMSKMETYLNPDGTQRTWNRKSVTDGHAKYSDNPYWTQYVNYPENWRNRVFGNANFSYQLFEGIAVVGSVNKDFYTDRVGTRIAEGSNETSEYTESVRENDETNADVRLTFNKDINSDFNFNGFVGANRMTRLHYRNVSETAGGLAVPGFYSLENSNSPVEVDDYSNKKRINSVLGTVNLGYKGMLFLDLTARNDWSSTLPEGANSYFYPATALSFILTELPALKSMSWFNFGKVRAGWAQVGNDTDPYQLENSYIPESNFGSNPRFRLSTIYRNPNLKSETTSSMEAGIDLRFFGSRVRLDATAYDATTVDQIFAVDMSSSSGFIRQFVNAGTMRNKGVELLFGLTPVKTKNFSWDIDLNWAKNSNEVVELIEGTEVLNLSSFWGVYVTAKEGESYGMLRGSDVAMDPASGKMVVDADGYALTNNETVDLGSVLPDWTGGLSNTFKYKNFSLSALIDVSKGGTLFSTTNMFGNATGIFTNSVGNNDLGNPVRDAVADGGGFRYEDAVVGHYDGDGNLVIDNQTNESYVHPQDLAYEGYYNKGLVTYDASYYKLREVAFGYSVPAKLVQKLPINQLSVSIVGRNLAMWGTNVPNIDPEQATNSGNVQGLEGGANPSTRTFGFNLKFNF